MITAAVTSTVCKLWGLADVIEETLEISPAIPVTDQIPERDWSRFQVGMSAAKRVV